MLRDPRIVASKSKSTDSAMDNPNGIMEVGGLGCPDGEAGVEEKIRGGGANQ